MTKAVQEKYQPPLDHEALIAPFIHRQGELYRRVINEAHKQRLPFALGGGFAINAYTGLRRDTKDLDIYILHSDSEAMKRILTRAGMSDYYEQRPYDPRWIYRGYADGVIVDVIWAMANQVAEVDKVWLTRGPEVEIKGQRLRLLPPEELLWTKLYVLQRDRCDWPDLLNLIYWRGETMDWDRLLKRLGDHAALLGGLLPLFVWLCPGRARTLPNWLWERLNLVKPSLPISAEEFDAHHVNLIDSRPWFIPAGAPEPGQ
ncbi:MAG: hypothetical protein JMDDDDMK_01982 [Acidobacteria bacterium]|nr:hypothetical protein [Acidobacteriota bacterium]